MVRVKYPRNSVFRDILEQQYDENVKYKLFRSVKGSQDWVQRLGLLKKLPIHTGCVNCICWNEKGDCLLSGSDDQHLVISHAYNYKVLTNYKTNHKANIFSAKFLPCTNDTGIVSCSGDGMILYSDLSRLGETHNNVFNCHIGTTYEVATIPNDPHTFLSCGEDYTVRSFDLRTKEKCLKTRCTDVCSQDIIISCQRAVTALTVNANAPHQLAIGCSDSTVRIYDRRMLSPAARDMAKPLMSYIAPGMEGRSYRITSLSFSPRGEDILVSYSSEHLYLFGVESGETTTLSTVPVAEEAMTLDLESPIAPVRRLRLRGDWSDTGPDARPQNYPPAVALREKKINDSAPKDDDHRPHPPPQSSPGSGGGASQARPTLHGTLMQRMTDVLSRMLNDPATRAALSHGGEGAFPESDQSSHSDLPAHDEISTNSQGNEYENELLTVYEVEDLDDESFEESFSSDSVEVLYWIPLISGSEGEEPEEEPSIVESVENTSPSDPLDLPLPSFSSSFTQTPPSQPEPQEETMEIDEQNLTRTESAEEKKREETPSTSSSSSVPPPESASTSSNEAPAERQNISHLNELSSMYHGFVEKLGVEPMVNLMYSDVGSTASYISVFVGDEVSRQSTSADSQHMETSVPNSSVQGQSSSSLPEAPENKNSPPATELPKKETETKVTLPEPEPEQEIENPKDDEHKDTPEEDTGDSDDEFCPPVNLPRAECRLVHPIEKHMEEAIRNVRKEKDEKDELLKTRKSYFKQKFVGHRNARTMIKEATFWGDDYVISGSDCGHVFMWERGCGKLRMLLEADHHVVNCVQPHPFLPLLATSGIDYDVKLWAPIHSEPAFDQEMADELMKRNAVMLEETKDTITVPASFMIRMLACLNQIRRGGRNRTLRRESNTNSD